MRIRLLIVALCVLSLIVASSIYAVPVDGRVVDRNGASQAQVKVELYSGGNLMYSAWTDADGNFSIADVAEGSYTVKVKGHEIAARVDGSGIHPNPLVVG